jgi:ABC-2 type transport system permease protein
MAGVLRYFRLWVALCRFGLLREMAFRSNFLVKVTVEVLWFGLMLVFYQTVFRHAGSGAVAGWSEGEYLFFVGCYFALEGVVETVFMSNCGEFADMIRSGDLDFVLLKPIDEQFLVSCRYLDWTTVPNIFLGAGVMVYALVSLQWAFDPVKVVLFLILFGCGVALAYSFLLMLTSSSVWLIRNQSLYEMWWLFTTLIRYPREIFEITWAALAVRFVFTFVIPVMVIINVPASVMVKGVTDPWIVGLTLLATVVLVVVSRKVFRAALRRYRSASS